MKVSLKEGKKNIINYFLFLEIKPSAKCTLAVQLVGGRLLRPILSTKQALVMTDY